MDKGTFEIPLPIRPNASRLTADEVKLRQARKMRETHDNQPRNSNE